MFVLLLALLACTDEGADYTRDGRWVQLRPPPGVTGYECWAWLDGFGNASRGGPECFPVAD